MFLCSYCVDDICVCFLFTEFLSLEVKLTLLCPVGLFFPYFSQNYSVCFYFGKTLKSMSSCPVNFLSVERSLVLVSKSRNNVTTGESELHRRMILYMLPYLNGVWLRAVTAESLNVFCGAAVESAARLCPAASRAGLLCRHTGQNINVQPALCLGSPL